MSQKLPADSFISVKNTSKFDKHAINKYVEDST